MPIYLLLLQIPILGTSDLKNYQKVKPVNSVNLETFKKVLLVVVGCGIPLVVFEVALVVESLLSRILRLRATLGAAEWSLRCEAAAFVATDSLMTVSGRLDAGITPVPLVEFEAVLICVAGRICAAVADISSCLCGFLSAFFAWKITKRQD